MLARKFSCYDGYNLTKYAIDGVKTQRRIIAGWYNAKGESKGIRKPPFKVGEEVYLCQPYRDIPELAGKGLEEKIGWFNKKYARVGYMPYTVRILNMRLERLHDITEEDAAAEGVVIYKCEGLPDVYSYEGNKSLQMYATAREAFRAMCDGLFGIGVWRRNPDVYVYEFEVFRKDEKK